MLMCGIAISLTLINCENSKQKSMGDESKIDISVKPDMTDSIQTDTIAIVSNPVWMGPLLLVNYNDAAILKDNGSYGDTLSLAENIAWVKNYLKSDTIVSIGRNGIQEQQFLSAIVKNPNGDCNKQVVLTLKHQEKKGFLASKDFLKIDSVQFFDHQKTGKLYFIKNKREHSFYDSIFGISTDTIKYDSHSYYLSGSENFIIEKRGKSTRMYNDELEEERLLYLNDEYRIAYKNKDNWFVSEWSSCLSNTNGPEPIMSCFGEKEILIVWGFSEGMGDYQMYVSHVDLSFEVPVFENGKKMNGYIGLGCD